MNEMAKLVVPSVASAIVGASLSAAFMWQLKEEEIREQRPGTAKVLHPLEDFDVVNRNVEVQGTSKLPGDVEKQLWMIVGVNVNNANTYYPQGVVVSSKSGGWTCSVSLGSVNETEDGTYTLIVGYVAPQHAATLSKYVSNELGADEDGLAEFSTEWMDVKAKRVVDRNLNGSDSEERKAHKRCT